MRVGGRSAGCTLGVGTRLLHFHLLVLRDVLPKAAQQLHVMAFDAASAKVEWEGQVTALAEPRPRGTKPATIP